MGQDGLVQGKVDFCGARWASVGEGISERQGGLVQEKVDFCGARWASAGRTDLFLWGRWASAGEGGFLWGRLAQTLRGLQANVGLYPAMEPLDTEP